MSLRRILVAVYGLLMVVVAIAFLKPLLFGQVQTTSESKLNQLAVDSEASVFQPMDD